MSSVEFFIYFFKHVVLSLFTISNVIFLWLPLTTEHVTSRTMLEGLKFEEDEATKIVGFWPSLSCSGSTFAADFFFSGILENNKLESGVSERDGCVWVSEILMKMIIYFNYIIKHIRFHFILESSTVENGLQKSDGESWKKMSFHVNEQTFSQFSHTKHITKSGEWVCWVPLRCLLPESRFSRSGISCLPTFFFFIYMLKFSYQNQMIRYRKSSLIFTTYEWVKEKSRISDFDIVFPLASSVFFCKIYICAHVFIV